MSVGKLCLMNICSVTCGPWGNIQTFSLIFTCFRSLLFPTDSLSKIVYSYSSTNVPCPCSTPCFAHSFPLAWIALPFLSLSQSYSLLSTLFTSHLLHEHSSLDSEVTPLFSEHVRPLKMAPFIRDLDIQRNCPKLLFIMWVKHLVLLAGCKTSINKRFYVFFLHLIFPPELYLLKNL